MNETVYIYTCLLQVFVATTNIGSGQGLSRSITYHPYSDGTSKTIPSPVGYVQWRGIIDSVYICLTSAYYY